MACSDKLFGAFARREDGGGTIMSLFILVIMAMLLSIAVDATNGWRNRTYLSSVADMGAHAGAVAIAEKKTEAEIVAQVRRVVEANMPTSFWGNVLDAEADVTLVEYDVETGTFVSGGSGKKNAVVVRLERSAERGNPINTFLMRFVGINTLDASAISAGVFEVSGICNATDGFFARERVRISSQADIGGGICVHSEDFVWLPQQNVFRPGSYVSMPDLDLCQDKCTQEANPGIYAIESHMVLPDFGGFIQDAHDNFLDTLTASALKSEFFLGASDDDSDITLEIGDTIELVDDGIIAPGESLGLGQVIDLSHAQFHGLSRLPAGLVYRVNCPSNGNGPNTRLTFDGSTGQMEDAVLLTNCSLNFDDGSRIAGSVVITTRDSNSSVINAGSSTEIGDPTQNCHNEDRSIIMAMSPVSVPAEFTMSNLTLIVDDNVDIASATSAMNMSRGFAVYATGRVDVASQHTFRACGDDGDYLVPVGRVLRLVLPPSPQQLASMN